MAGCKRENVDLLVFFAAAAQLAKIEKEKSNANEL